MSRAPSLDILVRTFPSLTRSELCDVRHAIRCGAKMATIDRLLKNYGVEYIRNAAGEAVACYSNSGDMYAPTIIRDYITGTYKLTTVGDWVEQYEKRHAALP